MNTLPNSMKAEISRNTGDLDHLRGLVVNFLRERGVEEEAVSAVELSVYEAAANIVEHGNQEYRNRGITLELMLRGDEIEADMAYYGEMFDITAVPLPDVEEHYRSGKKRGLGIYFIRTLMDSIEYTHKNMISTLRMVKKI